MLKVDIEVHQHPCNEEYVQKMHQRGAPQVFDEQVDAVVNCAKEEQDRIE